MVKNPTCQCRRLKRYRFDPWVGKIPWRRAWQPTFQQFQHCCMENPVDTGAWRAGIRGVTQSQTQLKQFSKGQHMIAFDIMYYRWLYTPLHYKIFYLLVTCLWHTIGIFVAIPYPFNELIIMLKCTLYC